MFYFLFVAYLIRFFGIIPTFAISIAMTAAMFVLYAPNVFGRQFAFRFVGTYLFLLTVVFSLTLHDAHLPGFALRGLDLRDLHVDHDFREPLGYLEVADRE